MSTPEVYKKILSIASDIYISEPMIVGGIPRDLYLGLESNKDVDLTTNDADSPRLGISYAIETRSRFRVFEDGHVSVYRDSGALDFSGNHISEAAVQAAEGLYGPVNPSMREVCSRDFKMNTLHMSMSSGAIEDPLGIAEGDLANKVVSTVVDPAISFDDDIRRVFRAINFSSRLGFSIDGAIVDYARENVSNISRELGRSLRDAFITSIIGESISNDSDKTIGYLLDMKLFPIIPLTGLFKDEVIKRRMVAKYLDESAIISNTG